MFEVTARVAPGREDAFDELTEEMSATARTVGRALSIDVTRASGAAGLAERHVAVAFASDADLAGWLASPEHAAFISRLGDTLAGRYETRVATGMEGWVPTPGARPPKRWKSAVAIFTGLLPLLILLRFVAEALHFDVLGPLGSLALSVALSCVAMTWLVMPTLARALNPWLSR